MILKLIATRIDGDSPENKVSHLWSNGGGSIGRGDNNDWILPCSERFLSRQHAVVEFKDGDYWIRDTSTSGVFFHKNLTPLGKGNISRLHSGDQLRMGGYQMLANVEGAEENSSSSHLLMECEFIVRFLHSAGVSDDFIQTADLESLGKRFKSLIEEMI